MSLFVLLAAANAVPEIVGGLQGCWNAPGSVRGHEAPSVARGTWHIDRLYFMLQLKSVVQGKPYKAAIIYGAGPKPGTIYSYWLDVVGGAAPVPETGSPTNNGFDVAYDFGDSVYSNHFRRSGSKWQWTIIEQQKGKPERLFAEYKLTSATCRGKKFDF